MTSSLKILFISRAFSMSAGGMERLSFELHQELRQRASLKAITYSGPRFLSPLFVLICVPAVLWAARGVDVVYLGDPLLCAVGWLVRKLYRLPVVVTVHGLDLLYNQPVYQWYLRLFFYHLSGYVAISSHVASLLYRRKCRNVTMVSPGLRDRVYRPQVTRQNLEHLVQRSLEGNIVLATIGRLVARKGHAWFITQVLPSLPKSTIYVIAGEGAQRQEIQQAMADTQQTDRVVLLGRTSEEQNIVLYNSIDAFIQPNISQPHDAEGFGIVLLEAASAGCPVFAADLEGIKDAIIPGQNGHLLPAGNAAAWTSTLREFTIKSHPKPRTMAVRDFTLKRFSWATAADKYVSFFRSFTLHRPAREH